MVVLLFVALALSGCIVTKQGMYDAFDEDVKHLINKPFEQAFYGYGCPVTWFDTGETDLSKCERIEYGFLSPPGGYETKYLENGNELYRYADFWAHKGIYNRPDCAVYIEVNPSSSKVVNAWHKGVGCYRAY